MSCDCKVGEIINNRKIISIDGDYCTIECLKCKNILSKSTSKLRHRLENNECGVCSNKITVAYVNDVYTKRKDLLQYFVNAEDAIGKGLWCRKKVNLICPYCGTRVNRTVEWLTNTGFVCDVCQRNTGKGSFFERIFAFILYENNINFEREKIFPWGKQYRYDFYIKDKNIIIELNGIQHYSESSMCKDSTLEERMRIDNDKMELAKNHQINKYYFIKCIDNNVEKFISELKHHTELIDDLSLNLNINYSDFICSYYDSIYNDVITEYFKDIPKKKICKKYNISKNVINDILQTPKAQSRIQNENIITHRENIRKQRVANAIKKIYYKEIICLETLKIYNSYHDAERDTGINRISISKCCNRINHYTVNKNDGKQYHWLFKSDYDSLNEDDIKDILQFKQACGNSHKSDNNTKK